MRSAVDTQEVHSCMCIYTLTQYRMEQLWSEVWAEWRCGHQIHPSYKPGGSSRPLIASGSSIASLSLSLPLSLCHWMWLQLLLTCGGGYTWHFFSPRLYFLDWRITAGSSGEREREKSERGRDERRKYKGKKEKWSKKEKGRGRESLAEYKRNQAEEKRVCNGIGNGTGDETRIVAVIERCLNLFHSLSFRFFFLCDLGPNCNKSRFSFLSLCIC